MADQPREPVDPSTPPDDAKEPKETQRPTDAPPPLRQGVAAPNIEGPASETDALKGRAYVPVDEWQIDNAEEADMASWGDDPPPTYTDELDPDDQAAADARVKAQTDKVASVAHLPAS